MIGQSVSHYVIKEKLGEGGMGVVYKAEDFMLNRIVALKFLPPNLTRDSEVIKRFINEALAASSLEHPNICTVYEIDESDDNRVFICLAYYQGETLREKLHRGPLDPELAENILIQIVRGLARAHEAGIIHRDLKPANLMITERGELKILDFGLAKLSGKSQLTKSNTTLGTIAYMSPEQIQGKAVDHRTDIWSLGVILYEMLTGQLPFRFDIEATAIYSIINEDPVPVNSVNPRLPENLINVAKRSLQKELQQRYNSCHEVLAELGVEDSFIRTVREIPPKKTFTGNRFSKYGIYVLIALFIGMALFLGKIIYLNGAGDQSTFEPPPASIAVLPFVDLSPGKDQQYFCDGIAEALIHALTKIQDLLVVSRTSSFQFKGSNKDIRRIGERLNVSTIVEGSVRKDGNQLRITAQCIDIENGFHIWSQTFDKEMKDVFAIQDEITSAIVKALKPRIVQTTGPESITGRTDNLQAYQLYLMGRYHWNKRTDIGLKKGVEYFQKAISFDPNYALAHVGLAGSYLAFGAYGALPLALVMPKAKEAAEKALSIDTTLAEAHAALGVVTSVFKWDWDNAEQEFRTALELNPGSVDAHHFYAHYLSWIGKFDESMHEFELAQKLDPLSVIISTDIGWTLHFNRKYDQALVHFRAALDLNENFFLTHFLLGHTYLQMKKYDQAISEFQIAIELSAKRLTLMFAGLGHAYARAGMKNEAFDVLDILRKRAETEYVSGYHFALIYIGLGDKDNATEWLKRASEEPFGWLVHLKIDPVFDPLRSDSRFTALLRKMGME
ncbi:MAG: protein kinase [bacterium]